MSEQSRILSEASELKSDASEMLNSRLSEERKAGGVKAQVSEIEASIQAMTQNAYKRDTVPENEDVPLDTSLGEVLTRDTIVDLASVEMVEMRSEGLVKSDAMAKDKKEVRMANENEKTREKNRPLEDARFGGK